VFGNKKKLVDQLRAEGATVAWATVVKAGGDWQSTSGAGRVTDHVKLTLRVEPEGGEPFEATFKQAFAGIHPIQAFQCKVIYDPQDHSRIAVIEGSEAPPGISHDRAERSAALRAEAIQAARTGHIADFVAKRQAEAGGGGIFINGQRVDVSALTGQAQAPAPAPAPADVTDQLQKLADLHSTGALTDDEFQAAKTKLLASQ
jgi:hypothetical protein